MEVRWTRSGVEMDTCKNEVFNGVEQEGSAFWRLPPDSMTAVVPKWYFH